MSQTIIKNAKIVNEGKIIEGDVLIKGQFIDRIDIDISIENAKVIDAQGKFLIPGAIDDQVHFREPGLTHKGDIYTESRAAVAGGITSFMEMPNTVPNALTQELLEDKYQIAKQNSLANYSFFMGASNDNLEEVLKTDKSKVCGIKIFMGSSTGNMLVDNEQTLTNIFSNAELIIATHCEDEETVQRNLKIYQEKYGSNIPFEKHPEIRSEEACYLSSSFAIGLAKKHDARLHILHISTAKELELFDNSLELRNKKITAEACIHHLWFSQEDYKTKGGWIKWNPAVKQATDRDAIFKAVLDNKIDVIATDHAPHSLEEKQNDYMNCPSGGPLVQHAIPAMMEYFHQGKIPIERMVEKMSHNPAILFEIEKRGYIREGYFADLVLIDPDCKWKVSKNNILYKCGWSPFEGEWFQSKVTDTIISGHHAYSNGVFDEVNKGERLMFNRD